MAHSLSVTTDKTSTPRWRRRGERIVLEALDPRIMSQLSDSDTIEDVAADAADRLARALKAVASGRTAEAGLS